MPSPAVALIGGGASILGSVMGSRAQADAAGDAAAAQSAAAMAGIAEQRRQFDAVQKLLSPYVNAGTGALSQQQAALGLSGTQAQQDFISGIQASPEFGSLVQQGENAMLQNASATGGLRGGNLQGALAQFRPNILNQLIQQRYANLGGLTSLGQSSAVGVGNAGMQTGQAIAQQYGTIGQAQAGSALAQGQYRANMWNLPSQIVGMYAGAKMGGLF